MENPLVRYQQTGDLHFVTFSCYQRRPYLGFPSNRDLFERSLETMRVRYDFLVCGYVVMPEHVHLLISEPKRIILANAIQALKLSVSVQRTERPFWHTRYYDFNVFTAPKRIEKLKYIHRNPVKRGLVTKPEQWTWSSFRHYQSGEAKIVQIDSQWTAWQRDSANKLSKSI
jgi:putative transposase